MKYKQEHVIKGLGLSPGVAVGRVCRFNDSRHSNVEVYKVSADGVEEEVNRAKKAIETAIERVEQLKKETEEKLGLAEGEIFTAHRMILEDPALVEGIVQLIRRESTNAEAGVMYVLDSYEARMRQIAGDYMQDRAGDFMEIKNRLLDNLRNMKPVFQCVDLDHCQRGRHRIVVSTELTPGMTIELDTSHTLGFVTERGGVNSHAAILARALGIPAVSGVPDIHSLIRCGTEIAVNGDDGEVIVWPSENSIDRLKKTAAKGLRRAAVVDPVAGFCVMANISVASEIKDVLEMQADGVGLYRTEFEFMTAGRLLSEDEQFECYSGVVRKMQGKPVTFRLFDAGGDKPLPFIELSDEENPALGWRGGRLLLGHPELMRTQARAIARASLIGPVRVLYPMVVDLSQYRQLRKVFDASVAGIDAGNISHGIMFEVPSACLDPAGLIKESDFASIGTNDLIQYLFAVDRNNAKVAYDYSPDRKIFWKIIKNIARTAAKYGRKVSVCGELAGDPRYIKKLMQCGVFSVSVSTRLVSCARTAAMDVLGS